METGERLILGPKAAYCSAQRYVLDVPTADIRRSRFRTHPACTITNLTRRPIPNRRVQ